MSRALGVLVALGLALGVVAGCGGGGESATPASSGTTTESATTVEASETETAPDFDAELCVEQLGDLHEALTDLDSRLSVGLNFSAYSDKVGDARVAYDRIDFDSLDPVCTLLAGVQLEKALNSYTRAYNRWNTCIGDYECDTDSINGSLQKEWARAQRQLKNASPVFS